MRDNGLSGVARTLDVRLERNGYPVYLGAGILPDATLWNRHLGAGKVLIVTNEVVAPLYLDLVREALHDRHPEVQVIPDGEVHKTVETWYGILDKLISMQARRDASLVALGGGVVGDITGFAAASYMRGIRFLQAPTTLLAQVDASVGGKTAINHPRGKNLVGAFHQPEAVIMDSATLATLPKREFNAGMAEVVKYGAIRDPSFFDWLEANVAPINSGSHLALERILHDSVANKADIVAQDEKEAGVRALLNFGHSFGHALEAATSYSRYLHGEAVAIGMVTAGILSENRGLCPQGTSERLAAVLSAFGLPVRQPRDVPLDGLMSALALDKKAVASGLRLILLHSIGDARIDLDSLPAQILAAMEQNLEK